MTLAAETGDAMTWMHGTTDTGFDAHSPNPETGDFNICLTDDIEIADAYTQHMDDGDDNEVYEIELVGLERIATQDDLEDAARACGISVEASVKYELADSHTVRDELRSRGFQAVQHEDDVPMWGKHDTLRILDGSVIGEVTTW